MRVRQEDLAWLKGECRPGESLAEALARVRRDQENLKRTAVQVVTQPVEGGAELVPAPPPASSGVPWGWIAVGLLGVLAFRAGVTFQRAEDGSVFISEIA